MGNSAEPEFVHCQKEVQFKVYVAVDFGTDGCGLAFAFNDKDDVTIFNKWNRKKENIVVKTRTQILLNEKDNVVAFGNEAKRIFIGLMGDENKEYKLFERFKMALYDNNLDNLNDDEKAIPKKIDIAERLKAVNGRTCPSEIVFVAAFKHLHNSARKHLMKIADEDVNDDEIQWIITVPAIWSDKAKNKMKEWAITAGLVNNYIKGQCKIVYEPDCASLAIQKEIFKQKQSKQHHQNKTVNTTYGNKISHDESNENELSKILRLHQLYDDLYHVLMDNEMDLEMLQNLEKTEIEEFCKECGFKIKQKLKFRKLMDILQNKQTHQKNEVLITDCKHQINEVYESIFIEGEKYILIDAGGGTVDVSCHRLLSNFGVNEIHHPTGGKWGSCYIDDQYMQKLENIFTKEWMNEFQNEQPNVYTEIIENFQKAKSTFYENSEADRHRCELPDDFIGFLEEKCNKCENCTPEEKIEKAFGKSEDIVLCDVYLEIHVKVWKSLFDSMIDKIISHIHSILELESLNGCKYLCLVGGFSCSKYLQYKMENEFGRKTVYKLTLIIPETPILSVVKGAAYLGITENYVRSRKLKKTYGIEMIGSELVEEFRIVAHKNQEIRIGDKIKICASTMGGTGHSITIPILCSNKTDPKISTDGYRIGNINLPVLVNEQIMIEFHFYDTTISVFCYCRSKPNCKKHIELLYN